MKRQTICTACNEMKKIPSLQLKYKDHSNILYKFINNELHLKEMYSSIWFLFSTPKKVISRINVIPNLYGSMCNVTR